MDRSPDFYRFLAELQNRMPLAKDLDRTLRFVLREAATFMKSDAACVFRLHPSSGATQITFRVPHDTSFDTHLLAEFLAQKRPRLTSSLLLIPLTHRCRTSHGIALRRAAGGYGPREAEQARQLGISLSRMLEYSERLRISRARVGIDKKILKSLRPEDLFYQILHTLRQLTAYDHSSTLLINKAPHKSDILTIVAEQIACRRTKSPRIGKSLTLSPGFQEELKKQTICAMTRDANHWNPVDGQISPILPQLLDDHLYPGPLNQPKGVLCACIYIPTGLVGILAVAASYPQFVGPYEIRLLREFLPYVALAIQNFCRVERLEEQLLDAERRQYLATILRGVAHDINNAIAGALPLTQQILVELASDPLDRTRLKLDLEHIQAALRLCRRTFTGTLAVYQSSVEHTSTAILHKSLHDTLAILQRSLEQRRIRVISDISADLPDLECPQADLDQLLLNLLSNAYEAMPRGGILAVNAKLEHDRIAISVTDTGVGISPSALSKVTTAFYSTKPAGTGLGLAICQGILDRVDGTFSISSIVGEGTEVSLSIPIAQE